MALKSAVRSGHRFFNAPGTPDGDVVRSDHFVVAVCTCRRSKRFPLCDTSHRKRVRTQDNG
ncbi:CDGSH iron-sulfur domain-containing protein [Amycolatopsis sp. DSM 110486]|uniref:CDGSH iron-sulfur domain-containing protein n=1 Tax=Amycolatopsis sp. DSM 110486 TaxID=2865832 RepID=UPI001C6A33D7|nr:CDGSH iron-sulfur domain-containing protein [Amycolatopsis sp. DSM 110486]QYN18624.1 CDGSH iron-sulfur domain-containing protein [Amycolatopsis sp. DSM 110486]